MKIIESAGTPTRIGHITGEALRDEIRQHLAIRRLDLNADAWTRRLPTFVRTLRDHLPNSWR